MVNTRPRLRAWTALLLILLLVAGCGGGGGSNTAVATPSVSNAPNPVNARATDWNGLTTFHLRNQTGGAWADDLVYWAIIGRDWNSGEFVYASASGQLVPMRLSDNNALIKGGRTYSNYFHTLAQARSITIPALDSARVMMAVGSPMYIKVLTDGAGKIAYAGANIENPSDPNQDVIFDFAEITILPKGHPSQGIFVNTTRVDHFGFPLQLRLQGLNGFDRTVGETLIESREALFAKFVAEVPVEFKPLAQSPYRPYRIIAPAHASFQDGGANANHLQSVIDAAWAKYRTQDLVFTLPNLGQFVGRVSEEVMRITDARGASYFINGKPTTAMIMLGNGLLNDSRGASNVGTQLQLQAQVSAAFNRGVFDRPDHWHDAQAFYPPGVPSNQYARFWHTHNLQNLSYGFAYDDVGDQSPSLHTATPTDVTLSIGW